MKDKWDEGKIHTTLDGSKVRSKSELVIYNMLTEAQMDFSYETSLTAIDGTKVRPDFYFETHQGRPIVWEHYGLTFDDKYRARVKEKELWYKDNEYVKGVNYFVSYDDSDGGINSVTIEELVHFISRKVAGDISYEQLFSSYRYIEDAENKALADEIQLIKEESRKIELEEIRLLESKRLRSELEAEKIKLKEFQKLQRKAKRLNISMEECVLLNREEEEERKKKKEEVKKKKEWEEMNARVRRERDKERKREREREREREKQAEEVKKKKEWEEMNARAIRGQYKERNKLTEERKEQGPGAKLAEKRVKRKLEGKKRAEERKKRVEERKKRAEDGSMEPHGKWAGFKGFFLRNKRGV